jgi:hypothetical protein
MTQRAPRPVVARRQKPSSLAMFIRRVVVLPDPPAPALLILDSSVSAGWLMMAATTPATTPEARETEVLVAVDCFSGVVFMDL